MDEHSMASWWSTGLSGEDRDEWCTALDSGELTEDLLITLTSAQHRWLVEAPSGDASTTGPSMGPELQAFIAEECAKRLR